ncbi:MAG: cupredoxin family copper-binding protein [Hyphomicrobiales bacterium]|nr:cupredoxin family copper-binding protein [Hyphomicrobiales bacterium]MDE2016787.1 cupredoxin family copper-binding protein [Hyphomicrobiales bacterium]
MAGKLTRRAVVAMAFIAASALAATASAASHKVTIQGFAFSPASISVAAGDSVTWTNQDGAPHLVDGGAAFRSAALAKGQSFTFTFAKAGSFAYRCGIHPSMSGTVVVK